MSWGTDLKIVTCSLDSRVCAHCDIWSLCFRHSYTTCWSVTARERLHCEKSLFLVLWVYGGYRVSFKPWYSLPRWPKLCHKITLISICANTNIYDVSLFSTESNYSSFGESSNNCTLFFSLVLTTKLYTVCFLVPYVKNKLPFHVNSWRQILFYVTEIKPPCLNFRVSSLCNWTCLITNWNVYTCYSTVKLFNETFCY